MDGEIVISSRTSKGRTLPDSISIMVVDDDTTHLEVLARMLRTCQYEVLTVKRAIEALNILQERKGMFDLVLTDVHMPQIDGFELLEKVQEDFHLPVVMMSADDRESVMLRGLECGAAFYLVKPLTMRDLRNLWQFAFATKNENMRTTENIGTVMGASIPRKVVGGYMEAASSVNQATSKWEGSDGTVLKKGDEKDEEKTDDSTQEKKTRVVWTKILHNHFVDAVNQLGIDKAVPKKILELMNIQGLTRENVASHLQKYRLFLNRDQVTSGSLEPTTAKTLTSGSFMSGQSSLMPGTKRGMCRFPYQPGFGGNIHNLKAPNPMSSLGSACYFNWEAQTSNALFELRHRKSLPSSNQANLEQPLIGTVSSVNEQNDAHYLGFGIGHQVQTSSLIFRDASRGIMGSRDTMQVANEQPQARSRLYSYGPFDNNFSMLGFNDSNNDQNIERTGSYNSFNKLTNFNKLPSFNYTRSYAGIQITSTGELVGSSQTGIDHGQPLKDIDYSNKNGNFRGKVTHPAAVSSGYASSEGSSSFPIFASASSFPTISTNFIQPPPPQPPFPPPLQQELGNKYPMVAEDHSRLDSIKGRSNVENIYFPQPFDGADLGDLIFKQAVEFPDQQQGGEELVDADFNISSYKLY